MDITLEPQGFLYIGRNATKEEKKTYDSYDSGQRKGERNKKLGLTNKGDKTPTLLVPRVCLIKKENNSYIHKKILHKNKI